MVQVGKRGLVGSMSWAGVRSGRQRTANHSQMSARPTEGLSHSLMFFSKFPLNASGNHNRTPSGFTGCQSVFWRGSTRWAGRKTKFPGECENVSPRAK